MRIPVGLNDVVWILCYFVVGRDMVGNFTFVGGKKKNGWDICIGWENSKNKTCWAFEDMMMHDLDGGEPEGGFLSVV